MNLILINGKIKNISNETDKLLVFSFTVDTKITKDDNCYLLFRTSKETTRTKLKELLTENTEVLVEGSLEEHPELPAGIKIKVRKFFFQQSLHEKLEESFMTFDEINSMLDDEIEKYLKEERDYENE